MLDFFKSLFQRTKMEPWEMELLINTLKLLPPEYHHFKKQIDADIFSGRIHINLLTGMQGHVSLGFNPKVYKKFEKRKEQGYKLTGIKVFDLKSKSYLQYGISVSDGTIFGYSIKGAERFTIDVSNIDVSEFKKEYFINPDYKKMEKLLSAKEKKAINQDEVYEVILADKTYFHIKYLEDGDFIGMDDEKNIYEITHDPYEIKLLDCNLIDAIK